MIKLIIPNEKFLASYTEAYDEFVSLGLSACGLTNPREMNIFEKMENYRLGRNLKPGRVSSDTYWLVDEERCLFIGEIHLRHELNDTLRIRGGHIGYAVRYSCWNQGYGTAMLGMVLEKARQRGMDRVLCTCNDDNFASARVVEHNGFQLEDKVMADGVLNRRYWKEL